MAVHYRTHGFFINKADYGEANQLFTVYTKNFGKLKVLGRAIRKIKSKLRGGAELFCLSDIEFIQGKTGKTLTDAILVEKFPDIRKDPDKLLVAHKISKDLDGLIRGEELDSKIWNLLDEVFNKLSNQKAGIVYHYFLWNLFSILGYKPELYHCSICQNKLAPGIFYFGFKEGAVICQKCFKKTDRVQEINVDVVKVLRLFINKDWIILPKLKISSDSKKLLKGVSEAYLSEILSKS